jgi:hypothetical protein
MLIGRRAVCPSFPVGNQHSVIQASLIDFPTDSAERIEPSLASLTLVEEVPDRLFDQFIDAAIAAAGEFLVDLRSQIRWQRDVHGRFLNSFYAFRSNVRRL